MTVRQRIEAAFSPRERDRRDAYRQVWGTPAGRAVLEDLLRFAGMREQMHVAGDSHETAFRDGKRRVGLRIASTLELADSDVLRHATPQKEAEE